MHNCGRSKHTHRLSQVNYLAGLATLQAKRQQGGPPQLGAHAGAQVMKAGQGLGLGPNAAPTSLASACVRRSSATSSAAAARTCLV